MAGKYLPVRSLLIVLFITFSFCLKPSGGQTPQPYADIHVHSSIKPFNSRQQGNIDLWEYTEHNCDANYSRIMVEGAREVAHHTQSNFEALISGNVGVVCLSLVPIERDLVNSRFMNEENGLPTLACIAGIEGTLEFFHKKEMDYFNDLVLNIKYLQEQEKQPHNFEGTDHTFEIVENRDHLEELLLDSQKLAIILTIEGGHALGNSIYIENGLTGSQEYEDLVLNNIARLKGKQPLVDGYDEYMPYPVFSIGLNHFVWNGICGQARVFTGRQNMAFGKQTHSNVSVTDLGEKVIKKLLQNKGEQRILVDIKHMNIASRRWYYSYLDSLKLNGDTVPVIASHCAINGEDWNNVDFIKKNDKRGKNNDSYLNLWTVNLTKQDIEAIHVSKGLLGIMLDKYRIMGGAAIKEYDRTITGSTQRREILVKALMANILKVVETVNDRSAWDMICIGSDFDGVTVPLDTYTSAQNYPDLARDLQNYLKDPKAIFNLYSTADVKKLRFGYSPEEIVAKIMSTNVLEFMKLNLPSSNLPLVSDEGPE